MQKNSDRFAQIEENIYGHRKKLLFLAGELDKEIQTRQVPPSQFKLLDVGCGNAQAITFPLASLGYSITGLDNFLPVIEYAKAHNPHPNLDLVCGDIQEMTGQFDGIIAADVLEHLDHPESFLKKFAELLKPGGLLLLSVPNGFGPFEIENFITEKPLFLLSSIKRKLLKLPPPPWSDLPYNLESGHLQHFTFKRLSQTLESFGFKIETVRAGAFWGAYLTDLLFGRFKGFIRWNAEIADKLPIWMVSMWYLKLHKPSES